MLKKKRGRTSCFGGSCFPVCRGRLRDTSCARNANHDLPRLASPALPAFARLRFPPPARCAARLPWPKAPTLRPNHRRARLRVPADALIHARSSFSAARLALAPAALRAHADTQDRRERRGCISCRPCAGGPLSASRLALERSAATNRRSSLAPGRSPRGLGAARSISAAWRGPHARGRSRRADLPWA